MQLQNTSARTSPGVSLLVETAVDISVKKSYIPEAVGITAQVFAGISLMTRNIAPTSHRGLVFLFLNLKIGSCFRLTFCIPIYY